MFDGQVACADHFVDEPGNAVENPSWLIGRLASDAPARRVPSPGEYRFCPITEADCPDREDADGLDEGVTTDF